MAYIDKDELLKSLEKAIKDSNEYRMAVVDSDFIDLVNDATVIEDVVEVVRCEKCKHLTVHNSPTLYAYCERTHFKFEPFKTDTRTHFCSYGKRKG